MSSIALPEATTASAAVLAKSAAWLRVAGIAAQLALVLVVLQRFQLESKTFFLVATLATVGFVVNHALPMRYRMPFFASVSIASVLLVLGVRDGAMLVAVGLVIIGLCHLPVPFRIRVGLILIVGAYLAAARADRLPAGLSISEIWSPSVWSILGAIFMFRLALYLHALNNDEVKTSPARTLAYFFMVPNASFPLFPVVDYKTFATTHYAENDDAIETYQTGVKWIVRGLVQLLLYRYVYYELIQSADAVTTLGDLVQFVLATFLLYLRVSGQFHLIVGMLHLFGFKLPETHKLYYLSSSFTDFWRRINIYWKDFMLKMVFNPVFFRIRRKTGNVAGIGIATGVVFLLTWLLHSYQWFWLRGGFPITWPDSLFWGILGVFVVINAVREAKQGRKRQQGAQKWSLALALKVVGMFWLLTLLWSMWSAESMVEWFTMLGAAAHVDLKGVLLLVGVTGGLLLLAGRNYTAPRLGAVVERPWWRQPATQTTATLGAVLLLSATPLYQDAAPKVAGTIASLRRSTLNKRDASLRHKGYYEKLDNVNRFSTQVWEATAQVPKDIVGLASTAAWNKRGDFIVGDIKPNANIMFYRLPLTTNRWGMRDKDYEVGKAPGTYRIALLGPSHVMGVGVPDGKTFEAQLEDRLNRELAGKPYEKYEVLNFGVPAFAMTQQAAMLEDRVWQFNPDVVVVTIYPEVLRTAQEHLGNVAFNYLSIPPALDSLHAILDAAGVSDPGKSGVPVPSAGLRRMLGAVGISTRMPWKEGGTRIYGYREEIVSYAIRTVARAARAHGAVPVLLALDQAEPEPTDQEPMHPFFDMGEKSGMLVLNLFDVYDGHDKTPLRVAEWDNHPNVAGSKLIADRLFVELQKHRVRLHLNQVPQH